MAEEHINRYHERAARKLLPTAEQHRSVIGGCWDEIGQLQFDFLVQNGLQPNHRLFDVGCGSFRGGVHFIPYLDPGNYYGCDVWQELIDVGYERELVPLGLTERIPRENLVVTGDFDFSLIPNDLDFALAISVFTHLTPGMIERCLNRLWPKMRPGGLFFASFFEQPHGAHPSLSVTHDPSKVTTYTDRDPYHQSVSLYQAFTKDIPWAMSYVGEWGHPRGQRMLRFERV